MPDADEEGDAHGLKLVRRGDAPFGAGEDDLVFMAVGGELLQFQDLGAPALAEESALGGFLGLRPGGIDEELLTLEVGVHQVHDGDREAAVPAAEAHRHGVFLGEAEIAVDVEHHVPQDRVRRIAAVHGAADFRRGEGPEVVPLIVQLAIGVLQPAVEGEAVAAAFGLVPGSRR